MMTNNLMLARNIGISQKRKDSNFSSVQSFAPDDFVISGQFLVDGPGEVLVDVNFPVSFEGQPNFTFGGSMDDNSPIVQGAFPTVSGIVATWNYKELALKQIRIYRGARIAVVFTGSEGQKTWFHWQFTGKAFVNPVDNSGSLDVGI